MITILYAGLLGIFFVLLSAYVMQGRMSSKIMIGDGSDAMMLRRIRMHGNFTEYAPLGLLLLFLVDYSEFSPVTVHILGIMLVIGRVAHAVGLQSSEGKSAGRAIGMLLTILMILVASALLIYKFFVLRAIAL